MELIKIKRFQHPDFAVKKSLFKDQSLVIQPHQLKISAFNYSPRKNIITLGLTNGKIIQFIRKMFDQKTLTESKQFDIQVFLCSQSHKGKITCLIMHQIFQTYYAITGSADRTIKIWDLQQKSNKNIRKAQNSNFIIDGFSPNIYNLNSKAVMQTMVGHTGTIINIVYCSSNDTLFSTSIDKTIRIWKQQIMIRQQSKRDLFYHPWYTCYEILTQFSLRKTENPVYCTCFYLKQRQQDQIILLVGDTEGSIHKVIASDKNTRVVYQIQDNELIYPVQKNNREIFSIASSNYNYHRLSIIQIIGVPKDGYIFTISYDQTLKVYQQLSQKCFYVYKNQHKKIFTCMTWNSLSNQLILGDQSGKLYFISFGSQKEIEEIRKYQTKIIKLQFLPTYSQVLVVTENFVDVILIKGSVKSGKMNQNHTDSVIAILPFQPSKLTEYKIRDPSKLVSIALDNTMRIWDPRDLSTLNVFQSNQKAELTSLHYLKQANLFVTGHENGDVKLWNIQLGNSIIMNQQNSPWKHVSSVCALTSYIYKRVMSNDDNTQFLFSSGYDGRINIWQIFEKKNQVQSSLMSSTICPQLKYSILANKNQKISDKIGEQILTMIFYEGVGRNQGTQQISQFILAAGNNKVIYIIQMFNFQHKGQLKVLSNYQGHTDSITSMALDKKILFSASDDNTIRLWVINLLQNVQQQQPITVLQKHLNAIKNILIMDDTGYLVSQSIDGFIYIWDYPKGQILQVQKYNKQIHEKKQEIRTICYIEDTRSLYGGTTQCNILKYNITEIFYLNNQKNLDQSNLKSIVERRNKQMKQILQQ